MAGRTGFFQEPFKATQCEPHFDQRDAIGANLSTIEGTNALIVVIEKAFEKKSKVVSTPLSTARGCKIPFLDRLFSLKASVLV
ncbi:MULTISPECIES: hypothetical protein [Rhizobium]|uniref:Uncharacterized protein n=1 Tax=Rhizobium rhododendri TaxID=2506430 RepID=A0ABY8IR35_9HYPH|nr:MULTISPECIES: hypothetical protein [Rhizobium]TQX85217.1 hypothetical protein EQW76_22610 [Rhizobium sp. rho-13.1]TQY09505.1 hypothetical protein EQW74_21815 [Rhizobium sp. rho-1.1]WFS25986.1 hypothetical protein PR018_20965 [Rhizobium rhododendri]